ncbi:hypothetical protein FZC84_18800 [Rossellomorea vietnamensis]|uniref:Uncharacterized protein n=1 Tax=Rossellomorea vietnamensis TaxID=218284 RepID=A0A5D4M7E2_9BACI|nr:hypothetical protein [Rossellomorea vietnamensis]TYR97572.1 hypothetical protein FZC84_18800 [Rossellomorea vietnamensis]
MKFYEDAVDVKVWLRTGTGPLMKDWLILRKIVNFHPQNYTVPHNACSFLNNFPLDIHRQDFAYIV